MRFRTPLRDRAGVGLLCSLVLLGAFLLSRAMVARAAAATPALPTEPCPAALVAAAPQQPPTSPAPPTSTAQPSAQNPPTPTPTPALTAPSRASDVIPDSVVAAVTIEHGAARLREFRAGSLLSTVENSDFYKLLQATPQFAQTRFGFLGFAGSAGVGPWEVLETLAGDNLTLALEPTGTGQPTIMAACITDNKEAAGKLSAALNQLAGLMRDGAPDSARSRDVDGVRGYQISPEACYAVFDNVIALSNRPEALERMIRLRRQAQSRLSDAPAFGQARSRVAPDALAWSYVDLDGLRARLKDKWIPEKMDNGFGAMLLGGIVQGARDGKSALAQLRTDRAGLTVDVFIQSASPASDSQKAFFVPAKEAESWAGLELPRYLGQITLRRDLYGLWTQRDKLVSPKGLAQLSEFANNMSNLLGKLDFGDDFLAQSGQEIQFISNLQVFDEGKTPIPQYPAFGLLIPLKNAAQFGERLESATMMAFSFMSMQAAQNDQGGLMVDVDNYKGHKLICAKYAQPTTAPVGPLPQRYNFSPTAAVVKDRFVVGSTRQFIKDVIDAADKLPSAAADKAAQASSYVRVQADELTSLLRANLEPMIAQKMLNENKSRGEAEGEIQMLLKLLSASKQLVMSVDRVDEGMKATARLELRSIVTAK